MNNSQSNIELGAYYVPIWGKGHNERDLVKNAKPYFEGQHQPRIPLDGYYNDELLKTMKHQTSLAEAYGLDAFIFDWYWKDGKTDLNKPIENFIKCNTKMKFSVMRCRKTSKKDLPVSPGVSYSSEQDRRIKANKEDFVDMLKHCQKFYFSKSNYRTKDGRPYMVIYFAGGFISKLGREGFADLLETGKRYFREQCLPVPYFNAVVTDLGDYNGLGLDALTGYNFLPDFTPETIKSGHIFQDYQTMAKLREGQRDQIQNIHDIPYIPSISAGRDSTPRGIHVDQLTNDLEFPRVPILTDSNPETFGQHLRKGVARALQNGGDRVHICSRNERSEGNHLEPDNEYGYGYLDEVQSAKCGS